MERGSATVLTRALRHRNPVLHSSLSVITICSLRRELYGNAWLNREVSKLLNQRRASNLNVGLPEAPFYANHANKTPSAYTTINISRIF